MPSTIHNMNKYDNNKLSSFLWYNFHILNNDIPVKIINFLNLNILSSQMCVRLWSMFNEHVGVMLTITEVFIILLLLPGKTLAIFKTSQ